MAGRSPKPKKPSKPKAGSRPTKPARPPLRGGVGDAPAGQNPFADLEAAEGALVEAEMQRTAVNRPSVLENTRNRMGVKAKETLQQIADATLAAAYNHRAAPDPGTQVYARAFATLDDAAKERLLNALEPADAELVLEVFGTDISATSVDATARPMTAEQRAKARAREALEEAGLEEIEVVDVSRAVAPPDPNQQYVRGMTADNTRIVQSPQGWTPAQVDRGYRVIQVAPEVGPARRAGGGSAPSFASQRIDLQRSRIQQQALQTDNDFFFAIDEAKSRGDQPEINRLLAEKKAAEAQFAAILNDPDQVAGIARLEAEGDFADRRASLESALASATDPAYQAELRRKMGLLDEQMQAELSSFDAPPPPTGDAPAQAQTAQTTVVEVLADRAGEFTGTRPPVRPRGKRNPQFGTVHSEYRRKPGTDPSLQSADRLTPTAFEQLSKEAQRAVARGNEIQDAIERFQSYNPDFLETPRGKRFADEMYDLLESYPEALAFIQDPGLMTRQVPAHGDAAIPPLEGRHALPIDMRLTMRIGGEARADNKLSTQVERRLGRYKDIPADAPNRMAFILVRDAENASKTGMTIDAWRKLDDNKRRAALRAAEMGYRGKVQTEVFLPPTEEIARRTNRGAGGAQRSIDLEGAEDYSQRRLTQNPELSAERAAELEAEYQRAVARARETKTNRPAEPVEDITQTDEYLEDLLTTVEREPLPGSATGSPSKVRFDRDYALREGKTAIEKWQEKIFRLANESVDASMVADGGGRLSIGDRSGVGRSGFEGDLGGDMRAAAVREALGGDEPIRTRSGKGRGPRDSRKREILPLDFLVPQWRGYIRTVDGGEIVVRRPNADELAGFVLDQLDMPDPALAGGLAPHIQQAMDALEASEPTKPRAIRAAGTIYEPNNTYRRLMEERALGNRAPGDNRPLYNEESELAARQITEEKRLRLSKFKPEQSATPPDGSFSLQQDSSSGVNVADEAAGGAPTMSEAESVFANMRKGGKRGGSSTNIPGLLALTAAGVAGGEAFAGEGGEALPPVEYLAMAGRVPGSVQATASASNKAKGAKGGKGNATAPKPKRSAARPAKPAPTAAGGAGGGGASPPTTAAGGATPAPEPRKPMFPKSATAQVVGPAVRGVGGFVRDYLPDIGVGAAGVAAAPTVIRFLRDQYGSLSPAAPQPASSDFETQINTLYQRGGVFEPAPEERSLPGAPGQLPPPMMPAMPTRPGINQGSSNSINVLRQLLNNQRRAV